MTDEAAVFAIESCGRQECVLGFRDWDESDAFGELNDSHMDQAGSGT